MDGLIWFNRIRDPISLTKPLMVQDEAMEEEGAEAQKGKKTISYEEYKKLAFLLTKYIKQREEQSDTESTG